MYTYLHALANVGDIIQKYDELKTFHFTMDLFELVVVTAYALEQGKRSETF